MFLASGCSSVARNAGRVRRGLMRRDGQQWLGGGNNAWGDWRGNSKGGGSTVDGSSTSKNGASNHKHKSAQQFELKQS